MSDGRRYDTGDTFKLPSGREYEVTGVTYRESDGKRDAFAYTIRDKEELDVEREEQARLEKEQRDAIAASEKAQAEAEAEREKADQ